MARRHGNDERIYLRDFIDGVDLYKELLLEFALPAATKPGSDPAAD
jgi:hypothetical protein